MFRPRHSIQYDCLYRLAGNISAKDWGIDESGFKQNNVVFVGFVSDEENKSLLTHCRACIQPSKYEGFGIPPLEAIALGKNIMVSNATCLPEIYGSIVQPFNPDDYDIDIDKYIEASQNGASKLLEKYTWEKVAKNWYNLLISKI